MFGMGENHEGVFVGYIAFVLFSSFYEIFTLDDKDHLSKIRKIRKSAYLEQGEDGSSIGVFMRRIMICQQ